MRSLHLAIAEQLLRNLRESGTSRVLDRLLLGLGLLPLAVVIMCALLLPSTRNSLELYILVGVDSPVSMDHRVPFFLSRLPLPQAQLGAVTASQTRGWGLAEGGGRHRKVRLLVACHGSRALTAISIIVLFEYLWKAWLSCQPVGMRRGPRASCFGSGLLGRSLSVWRRNVRILALKAEAFHQAVNIKVTESVCCRGDDRWKNQSKHVSRETNGVSLESTRHRNSHQGSAGVRTTLTPDDRG